MNLGIGNWVLRIAHLVSGADEDRGTCTGSIWGTYDKDTNYTCSGHTALFHITKRQGGSAMKCITIILILQGIII